MLVETVEKNQSSYLSNPKHKNILIAVSGGSDSLALLNLCVESHKFNIHVATVDHGLRVEAAAEADYVSDQCRRLGVPHSTLKWQPDSSSSQSARLARYRLLVDHARQINGEAILLGHTLDDQAETLLMRSKRVKADSGTLGLSGMPELASYDEIKLVRPLLDVRREELRDYLRSKSIKWIDDPSNEKLSSERVRTRKIIQQENTLPNAGSIARFAALNTRFRAKLNQVTAQQILISVRREQGNFILQQSINIPKNIAANIFAVLVQLAGEQEFRSPASKLTDVVQAFQSGKPTRKAVGNCLITVKNGCAIFAKENRKLRGKLPQQTEEFTTNPIEKPEASDNLSVSLAPLERFRPASDDCIYEALKIALCKTSPFNIN